MVLLVIFAALAGAGTALSACVLPVLPVVLSAGITGGRRRPLGIVVGLALSFTFATVVLAYLISALGLPDNLLRDISIGVLLLFGIALLVPPLSARVEAYLSRFTRAPATRRGDGFASGMALGASLGFVYAPCAGPILSGVIVVSASQAFTISKLVVAFAYGTGSAAALYLLMLGGRRLIGRLSPLAGRIQTAMGAVMVLMALLLYLQLDIKFENAAAKHFPSALVFPTKALEQSGSVRSALADVRGGKTRAAGGGRQADLGRRLPVLGASPELVGTQRWFNTPGGRPLSIAGLRGHVVLVDFWTYTCINCIRTLPNLNALYDKYRADGLVIVGVHSPEFPFEKDASNVQQAIHDDGIHYPVVQDNNLATWTAFGNQFWPADYLIDARGKIRYAHFGEGAYETSEKAVRSLLAESGTPNLGGLARARILRPSRSLTTPETYLGAARAERFLNGPILPGRQTFRPLRVQLPADHLAYRGTWRISAEGATAASGAGIDLAFGARRVYLVLGSAGRSRQVRVRLDGRPIPDSLAGGDVHGGVATISGQRLYRLVELPRVGRHLLQLDFEPGISGYAFTFG